MAIKEHPPVGTLLICDFDGGFKIPEMVKSRPVVVISPKIVRRVRLCTVIALSTDAPDHPLAYHAQIDIRPKLPGSLSSDGVWVKGDMINAVSFDRLDFIRAGKDATGKRIYYSYPLSDENLKIVRQCALRGMGMQSLTKYL